jgi:hypothetical protein
VTISGLPDSSGASLVPGEVGNSLIAGPDGFPVPAVGCGDSDPSPTGLPLSGSAVDAAFLSGADGDGSDTDGAPVASLDGDGSDLPADDSSLADSAPEAAPAPGTEGTAPRTGLDALTDDDSDLDEIEEVADMFAELAESDGSSEVLSLDAPAGSATQLISW